MKNVVVKTFFCVYLLLYDTQTLGHTYICEESEERKENWEGTKKKLNWKICLTKRKLNILPFMLKELANNNGVDGKHTFLCIVLYTRITALLVTIQGIFSSSCKLLTWKKKFDSIVMWLKESKLWGLVAFCWKWIFVEWLTIGFVAKSWINWIKKSEDFGYEI